MNFTTHIKPLATQAVCLLFVLLFVYAAVSKLLDFEDFQVQLGQSPLLSAFAGWIAWLVPLVELLIALLLLIPKFRNAGLFAALTLMMMFSVYIFIVLHYSSFVPCSCGGILEKMSWNAHLVFNMAFVLLAALAILWQNGPMTSWEKRFIHKRLIRKMTGSLIFSILLMTALFWSSEEIMHHENPFIRRYPNHPAMLVYQRDLKFNSFYFSGFANGRIYLGNYTSPLSLFSFDQELKNQQTVRVAVESKNIPFQMIKLSVKDTHFYLEDGRVPILLRGDTRNWRINKELSGAPYFTHAEMMDSSSMVFRTNKGKNRSTTLGIFRSDRSPKVTYKSALLQKQIDGVFDTDGILMYSREIDKMIYLYFYRNEFIVADKNGKLNYRGHTIDTTSRAKIKVTYLKGKKQRAMSAPPLIVNANAAVFQNLLFVHSKIKGRFEKVNLWKQATILDVYDVHKNSYLFSFPIYDIGDKKLRSFVVNATHLYGIIGNELVVYELKDILKKEMKRDGLKQN